ncbi:MAG: hypothetical protein J07HN4v3_02002 [Halonotius sp. J07HN4]|nr:MAG: hypothetical protein J07HN4v3_02002 [Halonotius sp. J07HN4]
MCHHVDMDIDWEEAITEQDTETVAADAEEPALDAEEPELDAEESPQKAAPPADD